MRRSSQLFSPSKRNGDAVLLADDPCDGIVESRRVMMLFTVLYEAYLSYFPSATLWLLSGHDASGLYYSLDATRNIEHDARDILTADPRSLIVYYVGSERRTRSNWFG